MGYSRRPLHDTSHLPRGLRHGFHTKTWERWVVMNQDLVLALTIADLDLGALVRVYCLDRATGDAVEQEAVKIPTPREAMVLPGELPPFFAHGTLGGLSVRFDAAGENRTVLRAETERISTVLEVDARTESLSMAVPLGRDRFRYSVTGVALPTTGLVVVDGKDHLVDAPAFATLDRGRGRMPRHTEIFRATGAGINPGGNRLGLILTDGEAVQEDTGENATVVDGVLDGPRPPVQITAPTDPGAGAVWTIRGSWIRATFTPDHTGAFRTKVGPVKETGMRAFGDYSGTVLLTDGRSLDLAGVSGWLERSSRHW